MTERRIDRKNDIVYEFRYEGYFGEELKTDSIVFPIDSSVSDIYYLNNEDSISFNNYSNLQTVFSYPYSYLVRHIGNKKELVEFVNLRDAKERELVIARDYRVHSHSEKDSIDALLSLIHI